MTKQELAKFSPLDQEIMRRLLDREPAESIMRHLGMTQEKYDEVVLNPLFTHMFDVQAQTLDRKIPARLDRLATEALDQVVEVMRTAAGPAYRLRAALEILDRSGHVKVEKRLQINADAETIIKHMNQLGVQPVEVSDAEIIEDPVEKAVKATREHFDEADS
jgi:hypothetical protein